MRKLLLLSTVMLAAAGTWQGASANLLTNGSLTGPIANNGVPSGWTITLGSPDTMDETHNVGIIGVPYVAQPVGPSPDGGTWVGFGRSTSLVEQFEQTVNGLTVGATYDLSWYAGNFGAIVGGCPNYCGPNAIEVLINGVSIGDGGLLQPDRAWATQAIQFVATGASATVAFQLRDTDAAYLSIDGISLTGQTEIPEPMTLGVLGLSLLGLAAARRRR